MKHFTVNNVDTAFGFVNSKSFLKNTQFFQNSLASKLHCFPPTAFAA